MGDELSWKRIVTEVVRAKGAELPSGGWPHRDSRYWQIGIELDVATVEAGIADARRAILSGSLKTELPYVVLLMYLLRNQLPGVQARRLWPDVSAVINASALVPVRTEACAAFFRETLIHHFPTRLSQDIREFRFVRLLVDEAGVGSGRSRLIASFLRRLLSVTAGTGTDEGVLQRLI